MGNTQTFGVTEDMMEDYEMLTYLSKSEVLYLMKKFNAISPDALKNNFHHRIPMDRVIDKFPVLQQNPFQDRLFCVFSSKKDDCFSFEDLLDLCSAMSPNCPENVKAKWAFKVFVTEQPPSREGHSRPDEGPHVLDRNVGQNKAHTNRDIDEDNQISHRDISSILDRLVYDFDDPTKTLDKESKKKIADILLKEMDLHKVGGMSEIEFEHAMSKIPEFAHSFYFRL